MKLSPAGLAFIAKEEGTVLHVYNDAAGKPTIGVGHLLRPGESFPNGITRDQALQMLATDVAWVEAAVNACVTVPVPVSQNAFDALCSFTFNEGGGAIAHSSLLHYLNAGNTTLAAAHFLEWDKREDPATGQLVADAELHGRRVREAALFLTPDAPAPDTTTETSDPVQAGAT